MSSRLAVIALLLCACRSADPLLPPQQVASLDESRAVWEAARDDHADSYSYTRRFESWTGAWRETTITVEGGVVARRQSTTSDGESFDETGAALGTNPTSHAAVTIDELYRLCAEDVLTVDQTANTVYLTFHPSGLLADCSYVPNDCADDCNMGVDVESVAF